jgi:hypothetical protein
VGLGGCEEFVDYCWVGGGAGGRGTETGGGGEEDATGDLRRAKLAGDAAEAEGETHLIVIREMR